MHFATDKLFVEENDWAVVEQEMKKYYANILLPFSPQVLKLLEDFPKLGLDVEIIATDHGPIWRGKMLAKPFELYKIWATQAPENRAVLIYSTMWHSTEKMAVAIADGIPGRRLRCGGPAAGCPFQKRCRHSCPLRRRAGCGVSHDQ